MLPAIVLLVAISVSQFNNLVSDLLSKYAAQARISGYRILRRFVVFFIAWHLLIITPLDRLASPF